MNQGQTVRPSGLSNVPLIGTVIVLMSPVVMEWVWYLGIFIMFLMSMATTLTRGTKGLDADESSHFHLSVQ